jgi:anti-sigma regulatory factor (Ser/Thr protein kinase)
VPAAVDETASLPHDHVVNFYDDDDDIVDVLRDFVTDGLQSGSAILVVATRAHRDALEVALADDGFDVAASRQNGHFVCLDAGVTLAQFMVDGAPDASRFRAVIGPLLAAAQKTGRPVRAFGEMVALLWDDDNVAGAIEVERLWNDLARDYRFSLYCAYPIASLTASDDLTAAAHVCSHHSRVIAPASYETHASTPPITAGSPCSRMFVPAALAVRAARSFVTETLTAWAHDDLVADATIITSELATNAVRHANSPFRVSLQRRQSRVEISVHDMSPSLPVPRRPPLYEGGGRGLFLIQSLSAEWGVESSKRGKIVWSQLETSTPKTTTEPTTA